MELLPIYLRGLERLIGMASGVAFAYMGYKLYLHGLTKGSSKLDAKSNWASFVLTGKGPGLFFMIFGGIIVCMAIYFGVRIETPKINYDNTPSRLIDSSRLTPEGFEARKEKLLNQ